jgi:hypothetical protein
MDIVLACFFHVAWDSYRYHGTGIVIAARAVYRAGKAMAVFSHSPKPAQYAVVPTESRADP